MKRTLSLLLVLAMMVTMLSLPSFAEEETTTAVENSQIQRAERSSPVHNDEATPEPMEPVFFDPPQIEESEENVDLAALEAFAEEMRAASVQSEAQDGPSMAGGTFDAYIDDEDDLYEAITASNVDSDKLYRVKLVVDIKIELISINNNKNIEGNLYIDGNGKTITAIRPVNDDYSLFRVVGGKLEITDATINGCLTDYTAEKYASAIYATDKNNNNSSVLLRNCEIRNCYSGSYGAAVYAKNSYVKLDNCTLESCRSDEKGGAVYLYGCVSDIEECSVIKNSSHQYGGGIYSEKTELFISGGSISNNIAQSDNYGYGGGLSIDECEIAIIDKCTIDNNSAIDEGGGIYANESGLTLTSCTITNNTAEGEPETGYDFSYSYGGGLSAKYSTLTINGCTVADNYSDYCGGGICVYYDSFITLDGNTIQGNSAYFGGGVYIESAELTMTSGKIIDNTAMIKTTAEGEPDTDWGWGGGVCLYTYSGGDYNKHAHAVFNFKGGEISGNTAYYGGGVDTDIYCTFDMSDGSIRDNTADFGGGVAGYYSAFNITGGIITNNFANVSGGGIYADNLRDYEDNSIYTFTMSRKPYIVRNSNPDAIDNVALLDSVITLTGRVYITARVGLNLRLAEMDSPANPYTAVINYLKYKPLLSLFGSTKPFYSDNNDRISRSGSELVIKF